MAGQVEVEVVAVVDVVVGAEHGREHVARATMHVAQETALGEAPHQPDLTVDRAPVGQHERGDIDGVGMAVLGKLRAVDMCSSAGRSRRPPPSARPRGTQMIARRRDDHALDPAVDRRHHRAAQQRGRAQLNRAMGRGGDRERLAARRTRSGRRASRARCHERALAHHAGGEAGALLIGPPGLVPGDELRRLAAAPEGQAQPAAATPDKRENGTWDGKGTGNALKLALTTPSRRHGIPELCG